MRVPPATWRQVFRRDNGICQYCGVDLLSSFSSYWSATVDHVLAVSAGGGDKIENLKLACPACNGILSRSAQRATFPERKSYVQERIMEEAEGYQEWLNELRGRNDP